MAGSRAAARLLLGLPTAARAVNGVVSAIA
jgi:hypothetical protein